MPLFLISLGIFCVAVLVLEIGLRLAKISFPNFYQPDASIGIALKPRAEGWWYRENKNYVKINSRGLRDSEHSIQKPDGVFRIAVLGNSFCEALQVPLEKTFWRVVEQDLNEHCKAERRIQVLNFGMSNLGTGQALLLLRERVWEFQPDAIVLTILTTTDIIWNTRALRGDASYPYFVANNGSLELDDSFRRHATFLHATKSPARFNRWLLAHSHIWQVIWEMRRRLKRARSVLSDPNPRGHQIYFEPRDPDWQNAWDLTEQILRQIQCEVTAHGAQLLAVVLDNPIQVNPKPDVREQYMQRLGVKTLFYPDERLDKFTRQYNIPSLVLAPELQLYAEQQNVYLHGFGAVANPGNTNEFASELGRGHWNELGHRVVGQRIAETILAVFFGKRSNR